MRNYYFNIITKSSLILISFVLFGCNDIFEKNITKDQVLVLLPANADTLSSNQVHFKWEEVRGATAYELHVVRPSFDNIDQYVLDSTVASDEFRLILSPGAYAFKVRAINSAYQSPFTEPVAFFVDSVSDLSGQSIQLVSPEDIYYSNQTNAGLFSWQNLFLADYYSFQIWNGTNFGSGALLHQENNIYGTNYHFFNSTGISLEEGVYAWGIRGINDVSESEYSSRKICIDTTSPNTPDITFPVNNYPSPSNQLTLKWTRNGSDPGIVKSPVYANVQISFADSSFSGANLTEINNITIDSLQRQFPVSGTYWWRVYLRDEAGNESQYFSLEEKFIIP